jgi:DNA-directed RNA polymerase specialized sigma24 family protein
LAPFRPHKEHELASLSLEELMTYANAAYAEGEMDHWRTAMGILVYMFEDRVRFWVRKGGAESIDDLTGATFLAAIRSLSRPGAAFSGTTVGEFGSWLRQIASRRVVERLEERRKKPTDPLPDEHEGEEDVWGPSGFTPGHEDEVVNRALVQQAFDGVKNPTHQLVVALAGPAEYGFEELNAEDTTDRVNHQIQASGADPMTNANVYKIISRFIRRIRELNDEAGNPKTEDEDG